MSDEVITRVDSDGNSDLPAAVVSVTDGEYHFRLSNAPFGQYRVFAGTDADDDNLLCDDGEACGAYRTLDSPVTISVNGDITGIDFSSTFRSSLSSINGALGTPSGTLRTEQAIVFRRPSMPDSSTPQ